MIEYRQCPNTIAGLECTNEGKFRLNGREKKVLYCHTVNGCKATARIQCRVNGRNLYWQAAKLVAKTWVWGYKDTDYIIYIDGDCHNIRADNIEIADREEYYTYMRRNSVFKGNGDVESRKRKLQLVIEEASLTLNYFKTLKMDGINEHVKNYLYPCLMMYCLNTLHIGELTAQTIVPDCLARMYECIMNGMCLYNYERYCKKLLLNYKKKGNYGVTGKVPKPIHIEVEQLNLDCLWERCKVTQLKR